MRYYIKLDDSVTNTNLPILDNSVDGVLSNGSLLLVDFNKATPTLNNNAEVTNIASVESMALTGASTSSEVNPIIRKGTGYDSVGFAEITTKGGLHLAISQTLHTNKAIQNFNVVVPPTIRNYMFTNINNDYYISVWRRNTRAAATGVTFPKMQLFFNNTGNFLTYEDERDFSSDGFSTNGIGLLGQLEEPTPLNSKDNVVDYYRSIGISSPAGTITANEADENSNAIINQGGNVPAFGDATILNKLASYITYRVYVEDLTVSGRTYADVNAIDKTLYDEAFASGGKFFGDTFTSPTTLT